MVLWHGFLLKVKQSKTQLLHFLSDRLKGQNCCNTHIANIQRKRHVEKKNQKKDASFRRKLEKKFKLMFEGETDLYSEFPDLTRDQANTISKALSSPCTINDLYFAHMWVY